MLFFLVWFEYSSKYDWFLWIWVDYRFGVQWGSAGHAAYHTYHMLSRIHAYMMRRWYAKSLALHLWNRRIRIQWKLGGMNATVLREGEGELWVIINKQYYIMLHIPSVVFHPVRIQSRLTCCGRLCVFDFLQFPVISRAMRIRKSLQILWAQWVYLFAEE